MPIAENFTSVYSHDWEINFTQCAPNAFLKYVDLCNLLQLTAAEHSISGGLSFNDMQAFHQAWVLSRIRIEIKMLPQWQDTITVKTWIEDLQGARSIRNMEMYLNGEKIVSATTYWAVFNTQLRKAEPLALPHDHFELFPEWHATERSFTRINLSREALAVQSRRVVLSDLDIVNHVNNVKYLEWCLDTLQPTPILRQEIEVLEMNFMRELNLDDEVSIHRNSQEKPEFFTVQKEGKNCFALEIEWK